MSKSIMTLERLTPNEVAVISAIHQWRRFPETIPCSILSHEITELIAGFVSYLWKRDPYAVDVGQIVDNDLRLFEVQLLYVISEQLAGNSFTTSEILAWWFAADEQNHASACLNSICVNMQLAGVAVTASSWIRDYFQSMTLQRVRGRQGALARSREEDVHPISTSIH